MRRTRGPFAVPGASECDDACTLATRSAISDNMHTASMTKQNKKQQKKSKKMIFFRFVVFLFWIEVRREHKTTMTFTNMSVQNSRDDKPTKSQHVKKAKHPTRSLVC